MLQQCYMRSACKMDCFSLNVYPVLCGSVHRQENQRHWDLRSWYCTSIIATLMGQNFLYYVSYVYSVGRDGNKVLH